MSFNNEINSLKNVIELNSKIEIESESENGNLKSKKIDHKYYLRDKMMK